jgi:ABC-type transport system involved in cytochrome bd biosynthesis fused ATPase/permease subunit
MSLQLTAAPVTPAPARDRRRAKSPWRLAILLALAAAASGILLTGVSAWFLGAVALAGLGPAALSFNFHIPAAFVRLFAMSKTAGKYGERIAGHRAALLDQVRHRVHLLAAMAQAPATRIAGWQLGNQDRLSDYMEDVEDDDNARLRVDIPVLVLLAGGAALAAATAWLTPLALVPIVVLFLLMGLTLRRAMPSMTEQWTSVRSSQRAAGRLLGAALAAVVPLKAEHAFTNVVSSAFARFSGADAARLTQRHTMAMLDMLAGLAGPLAAISVMMAAWYAGSRGHALLIPAFLGFGWLALGETAQGVSRMALGRVREAAARASLDTWTAAAASETRSSPYPATVETLVLKNIPRQAPDGRYLGEPVNLAFRAGQPTALVGASGAGKTTLLKQIAGWLGDDHDGSFAGNGVVLLAACRRSLTHLGLHDAAILSDTVRDNLFAPQASDAQCWQALATVELDARVESADGLDAWISQDRLSLGEAQRLNLARALLSDAPIVLLDEPGEHLDSAQSARIMTRVITQLAKRIVIYSSHDENAIKGAGRIKL